jgi:hypothetical protein
LYNGCEKEGVNMKKCIICQENIWFWQRIYVSNNEKEIAHAKCYLIIKPYIDDILNLKKKE